MEDDYVGSVDLRTEEDKMQAETNKKRKLKTPAQLQALEEYYEDHKYPTESLKSEIAERLGLTEKQVSGWFCHRRLKDKRLSKEEAIGNGRMDRSSGVIQERVSEPGQDSCGSTKPGGYNYKHADLREVESQSIACQEFSPKNLGCHKRMKDTRLDYDMDETSSESISPLRPSELPQPDVPQMWERSKYGVATPMPTNTKGVIGNQLRQPSGYLKIKPKAEHPAITIVKRQLGNNFQLDGPPLGIEFDRLPIDAFQAVPKLTGKGPSNGTSSFLYNFSGRDTESRVKMPKYTYRPDDMYLEEQIAAVNNESEVCYSHHQPRSKTCSRNNGKLHHGWEPASNFDREHGEEMYGSERDFSNGPKYNSKRLPIQPIASDHFGSHAETMPTDPTEATSHDIRYVNPRRGKNLRNQLSNRQHTLRETHDTFERTPLTGEPEIKVRSLVASNTSERNNLVTAAATPDYESMDDSPRPYNDADHALKETKLQLKYTNPLRDFAEKAPLPIKYDRGSGAEVPSSSGSSSSEEDETGETSSSEDE